MSSPILVTGGTGTLGQLVIPQLLNAGCVVRVLSRHPRDGGEKAEFVPGDLNTGQGIDAAVDGTEIIVHCAGSNKGDQDKARTLVRAASQAGVRHLVNISVVGADRVPVASRLDRAMFGYFGAKLAAEQVIAGSGVPWTTLRATQFHELILMVARQMTRLPVIPFPAGFRFQPVDAGEVAARLAELALGGPAWSPTWPARASTGWLTCSAATSRPAGRTGPWCRCGSPGRPPGRTGRARTWLPAGPWAAGPGKTSWPLRQVRPGRAGPRCAAAQPGADHRWQPGRPRAAGGSAGARLVEQRTPPAAASWDSRCSMVRGPMIAAVTAGWRRTNAMASSIRLIPAWSASSASCPAASSFRWFSGSDRPVRAGSGP